MSNQKPTKPEPPKGLWDRFLEWLPPDWRAVMTHPRPFFVVTATVAVLIFIVLQWWHQERFDDLQATIETRGATIESLNQSKGDLEKENERLKIAAGIGNPDSRTFLSVLTNAQLVQKTANIVAVIRDMHWRALNRIEKVEKNARENSKLSKEEQFTTLRKVQREEAVKISHAIGSDSISILNELHRRIPLAQREHILGAGLELTLADPENEGQKARLLFVTADSMGIYVIMQMPILADELEALYKLLPPD